MDDLIEPSATPRQNDSDDTEEEYEYIQPSRRFFTVQWPSKSALEQTGLGRRGQWSNDSQPHMPG